MNKQTIFKILEIEETRNEAAIRDAYRKKLMVTNPEDDPQGFMKLREAYEEALKWIKQEGQEAETASEYKKEESKAYEAHSSVPVKEWMDKIHDVYTSIKKRFDIEQWRTLLDDGILQDLEYGEEAKHTLFVYLADYFRLNSATYGLLDTYFHIADNADSYKEFLPEGFVNYILNKIQDKEGKSDFAYEWFEGDEYAPYDEYLEGQEYLEKQIDEENIDEARDCLDTLKDFGIYHPFTVLEEARLYVMMENKEKAIELANELIKKCPEKYPDSMRIPYGVAEIYWKCDKKQQAIELFNILSEEKNDIFSKKYIALSKWEEGDLLGASKAGVSYLSHVQDDEFESVLSQIQQEAFDRHYKVEVMDEETVLGILKCCYGLSKADEGLALLEKNNQISAYQAYFYKYLFYNIKKDFHSALKAAVSYNVELQKGGEDERKEIPMAYHYEADANYNIAKSMDDARYATRQQKATLVYDNSFLEKAEEAIVRAIQWDPDKVMHKQLYFNILMEMKKYEEAYQCVDALLKSYPNWYAAIVQKQEVCFQTNRAQEVIDLYYRAKDIYAKVPQIYERAAEIFRRYNQMQDFKNILDAAKEEEVTSPMLEILELKYLHETHSEVGVGTTYDKAKELAKRLKEQEEKPSREVFSNLYGLLGRISHWLTKYKESRSYAKLAIKCLPDADNYYIYGWMLNFAGKYDKAVIELEYAKSICDDEYLKIDIMYKLCDCYYELMEEKESDYYAKKVIDVSSLLIQYDYKTEECYVNRCFAYIALEEYDKVIDDAKAVLKINRTSENAYYAISKAYFYLKRYDKAYYYIQKVTSGKQDNEVRPKYNQFRAMICEAKKDYKNAEKYYLAGLNYHGKDYYSEDAFLNKLIHLYKKMKLFDKAKEIMRTKNYNSLSSYEWDVLKLEYNYGLCDKTEVRNKIKKLLSKWEVYIKGALHKKKYREDIFCIANIYAYYLDDAKQANKFYKMYENFAGEEDVNKHLMYSYWVQGNVSMAKKYADKFMEELKQKYAFNPSQSAEEQYVNNVYGHKNCLFDMAVYYLCYGNVKKAQEYCNDMTACSMCDGCMREECTDYYELLGLLYEMEGDTKKALIYYKRAIEVDKDNYVARWKVEKGKV